MKTPVELRMITEDGEVLHTVTMPVFTGWKLSGWFMAFQNGFVELAKLDLRGQTMKVLVFMLGHMDFENKIVITQADVAKDLGINPVNVSRAVKELVEAEVLHVDKTYGKFKTYRVDPLFVMKGKPKNIPKVQKEITASKQ